MNDDKIVKKLIKALEDVISQYKYITYVNMNDDPSVMRARKLIKEIKGTLK